MTRNRIEDAPLGEDTSLDGTEKFPVSGSKYALIASIADTIITNNDEVMIINGNVVTLG